MSQLQTHLKISPYYFKNPGNLNLLLKHSLDKSAFLRTFALADNVSSTGCATEIFVSRNEQKYVIDGGRRLF